MVNIILKRCSGECKQEKPNTSDYFNKNQRRSDGLDSVCRECVKKRYLQNRDRILLQKKEDYQNNKEKYQEKNRIQHEKHKEQRNLQQNQHRLENLETIRAKDRQRWAENREVCRSCKRVHYHENKERLLVINKEYQQTPQGRASIINSRHKRRAAKNNTPKELLITNKEMMAIKKKFVCCPYCSKGMTEDIIQSHNHNYKTIEHIIPLTATKGGYHTKSNIICCCRQCNSSRQDKDLVVWLKEQNLELSSFLFSFLQDCPPEDEPLYKWLRDNCLIGQVYNLNREEEVLCLKA